MNRDLAQIEDTAIAWLAERDDGFAPGREREYANWLLEDPRHAATVARLEQTLGLLEEMPEFRDDLNAAFARAEPRVSDARTGRRAPRWLAWGGIAAALAVSVLTGWQMLARSGEVYFETSSAGYEMASLKDGSTVELNAGSAVRVQFTSEERHVNLEAGEAHFAVVHDPSRPFVVSAGGVLVRAVGTAFNVRLGAGGEVEVIVTEGKVQVSRARLDAATSEAAPLVTAGERLVLPNRAAAPVIERVVPAVMSSALAWQGRLVEFADAPLAEIVARFNTRNRVQLVLEDSDLGQRRIGGTFAIDEAEAFVRLLERNGSVVAERRGESEIMLRMVR
jgi:transmembrane sensor